MLVMGRKKKSEVPQGRARDRGEVIPTTFEFPPDLDQAIDRCAGKERRSRKAVVVLAIEEYLSKQGLWPPKPGA